MTPNHKKRGDNDSLTCRLTKFLLTASISNLTIMMNIITMKIILIRPQLYTCNNSPDTQKTFWVAIALLPCCPGFCASNAHTTPEACRVQFKWVVAKVGGDHGFRASHLRTHLHLQLFSSFPPILPSFFQEVQLPLQYFNFWWIYKNCGAPMYHLSFWQQPAQRFWNDPEREEFWQQLFSQYVENIKCWQKKKLWNQM